MKVEEYLRLTNTDEQNEEVNDNELTTNEECSDDELTTMDEQDIKSKRKVVGRIPKRNYIPGMGPPRPEVKPIQEIYIPSQLPQHPQFFQPPPPRQQIPRERELQDRVRSDVQYQMMLDKEIRRQQMLQRPKESISKRMLSVANEYATGGDGAQRVSKGRAGVIFYNVNSTDTLFRKPNVSLPRKDDTRDPIVNLNKTIGKIAPKIIDKKKKNTKGGFWI